MARRTNRVYIRYICLWVLALIIKEVPGKIVGRFQEKLSVTVESALAFLFFLCCGGLLAY